MGNMRTFHQDIVIANHGLTASMRGTVDDHILADDIIVTDDTLGFFSAEVEILWQGTDNRALMHLVTTPHSRAVQDAYERKDDAVVTNFHISLDICERKYLAVLADFRSRVDFCSCTYFTCHNYFLLSFINSFSTSTQCLIEIHHRLHLMEVIGNFR